MNFSDFKLEPHKYVGLIFGKNSQLEIIGCHKDINSKQIYMVLKCNICCKDQELFGDGLFKAKYCNLNRGGTPCGCAKKFNWTKEQQEVRIRRLCQLKDFKFHGFFGDTWEGDKNKLILECDHGVWNTTTISHFMSRQNGCLKCGLESTANSKRIEDSVVISQLLNSGHFHPETKFTRSDRKTSQGVSSFWFVDCPDCGEKGEGWIGNLKEGCRPCACSKQRATFAYINGIYDNENLIALKFGITRNLKTRIYFQNLSSTYEIKSLAFYEFDTTVNCKAAERECKNSLDCSVISKQELRDGHTETTYGHNFEKIIKIYENYGGKRL